MEITLTTIHIFIIFGLYFAGRGLILIGKVFRQDMEIE